MYESKHTPGPWATMYTGGESYRVIADGPDDAIYEVCLLDGQHLSGVPGLPAIAANAALIAAAPDLMAAATRVRGFVAAQASRDNGPEDHTSPGAALAALDAAIAGAEGH